MATEPLAQARAHLGEVVDRARHGGQPTILTDHGRPAAVVISHSAYEDYQRLRAAETERAVKDAITYADAHPDSGRRFTSVEEMRVAVEAELDGAA
jgi:prevent-host-death family protein